jgi:hypothetical protein
MLFEQLKTINGTDIKTNGENEERRPHPINPKEGVQTDHADKQRSLLLLQLEEMSFASAALHEWEFPAPFLYHAPIEVNRSHLVGSAC